ncbi:MAG: hypothetical protein P8X84_04895, partial [Candidatus Bathyarchaeota archaeon]
MNKKILSLIAVLSVVAMLSVPLSACAKSTTEEISFRIETWPDMSDPDLWSKYKQIIAGESGKVKLNRVQAIGIPPLLDEVPAGPMYGTGGVRLTIGNDDPIEGTVKVEVIHVNAAQELFQSEGTPDFKGLINNLEIVCTKVSIPVIVKEV